MALALLVTTLVAVVDLALAVPVAGVLAVGSPIAAVSARARAVLAVGAWAAVLVLLVWAVDGGAPHSLPVELVTVAVVTAISAGLAARRVALERSGTAAAHRHAQLAAVVDSCDDGIVGLELDGTITSWNAGAERLTGRGADRAVGVPIVQFVGPDAHQTVTAALDAIRAGRPAPHHIASRERSDGTALHVSVAWSPVRDRTGRVVAASAVFHDVYEREEERRALQDRVRQLDRLESLGRLVGGIAHEFNNLMAIVLTYAEFVEAATATDPAARADMAHVRGAAERATTLTSHLLTFAGGGVTRTETLSLDEVLRDTVPLLSRTLGADVELDLHGSPVHTTVRADVTRLQQVVVNLATNARDAMPEGGRLVVRTSVVQLTAGHPGVNPPPIGGWYVGLQVSDTGTGMTPDVAAHVFEPFFTTKDEATGTGLGLASVWGITTELGGGLDVRSEPGKGSVFTLYLPRVGDDQPPARTPGPTGAAPGATAGQAPGHTAQHPPQHAPQHPPQHAPARALATAGQPGSVLLVEDEDSLRHLVSRVLRRSGYEVVAEANGADALVAAAQREFDLLLTDVVMPGMSGPDVAAAVRDLHPTIRVLYTSGYARGALGPDRLLDDDVDLLPKPFTHAGLIARVTAALEGSDLSSSSAG